MQNKDIFETLTSDINNANMPESEKLHFLNNIAKLKEEKINILITGATGCGKSSTINALFDTTVAKVGTSPDPETMDIEKYTLGNMILWDSPGLGDGKEADLRHSKNIISKLLETNEKGELLIDLVLVILDAGSRDLGTSYELINQVIIPNLGEDKESRILIAINKADAAGNGRHWDNTENKPDATLVKFLDEKVDSIRKRIKESTGVTVHPIYYSAGYTDFDGTHERPYNLSKLLSYIVKYTPKKKRLAYIDNVNNDAEMWKDNDELRDYSADIQRSFGETFTDCVSTGAEIGGAIGSIFGETGKTIGSVVGAVAGGIVGIAGGILDAVSGCYITTAICSSYGKPDDCYELTVFRNFRDQYLAHQPDGKALIRKYYDTAPELVSAIDKRSDSAEIYDMLNKKYLLKCLHYIESGDNESCKQTYIDMVNTLSEKKDALDELL